MQSNIELVIVNNVMAFTCDKTECEIKHGDVLFDLVKEVYSDGLPLNTYLYQDQWDTSCDVTPQNESDIDALNELSGTFYLVTYPAVALPMLAVMAISVVAAVAVTLLMPMPKVPNSPSSSQAPSPNNSLSSRTNTPRIGGRDNDIYGELIATFDQEVPPYEVAIDHDFVEFSWCSIGRGEFEIVEAYDGVSLVKYLNGANYRFYEPDTHLVYNQPYLEIGNAYTDRESSYSMYYAKRFDAINGQVLTPPDSYIVGDDNIIAKTAGIIESTSSNYNFSHQFKPGDKLLIESASNLASANNVVNTDDEGNETPVTYNLNGTYTVLESTATTITLDNPQFVNTDWQLLDDNADMTVASSITLSTESQNLWTDWQYIPAGYFRDLLFTVIASNGLYATSKKGGSWSPLGVSFECESELLNDNNEPIIDTNIVRRYAISGRNAAKHINYALNIYTYSSDEDVRRTAAVTFQVWHPYQTINDGMRVRFRRTENAIRFKEQQTVDEIRIKDLFGIRRLYEPVFALSGLTHVYLKQRTTQSALSLKERQARALVKRKIPDWQNNDALITSKRIDDIIYAIATDPVCSVLTADDLDMAQIKAEVDAQIEYFGTDLCAQFCGTFDDVNVTTEEMIQTVAKAGFFTAYRINNKICLKFERPQPPVAVFNAHNILPDTFKYQESFGAVNDKDGVEVTYVNPDDNDIRATLKYPTDGSAINPEKTDLFGVRNKTQAHMHMMRRYWKLQYSNKNLSAIVADEGGIVVQTDAVAIANQNRADTQQGVINSLAIIDGESVLDLSSLVDFGDKTDATIFITTTSGIVDNIRCRHGTDAYQVILNRAPSQPISTSNDAVVRATYQIALHDNSDQDVYIVEAKSPGDTPLSHQIKCINYDARYYQSDHDFINNLI